MKPGPSAHPSARPRGPSGHHRRRWGKRILLVAAVLLVAGALAWALRSGPITPAPELPPLPDLRQVATELRTRLEEADGTVRADPASPRAVERLGRLYHANGYIPEAAACWEALRRMEPQQAQWVYLRAEAHALEGDQAGLAEGLERTVAQDAHYAPAWLRLAEVRFKTGDLAGARHAYAQRLRLVPGDPYARLGLVRVAQQEGQAREARELLDALVKDEPAFPSARNLRAELLAADGESAAAERERFLGTEAGRFRTAADPWLDQLWAECFDYERLCVRGLMESLTGQTELAEQRFERARALRPDAFAAYELLGNLYLDRQDGARALAWYEQGRRVATTERPSIKFYVNAAQAYRLAERPADAIRIVQEGLNEIGDAWELRDALGLALTAAGRPAAALAEHQRAVELNPADPAANYHLALAWIEADQLDEAVGVLQRSHASSRLHPPTLVLLAQIEMDSGRWRSAADYLQPLFAAQPDLPEARAQMLHVRLQAGAEAEAAGDATGAEQQYRAGLDIAPEHPELCHRLGAVLLRTRRPAEALPWWEKHQRLRPRDPAGLLALAQTYNLLGREDDARRVLIEGRAAAAALGDTALEQRFEALLRGR